jgi:hypothetical protein
VKLVAHATICLGLSCAAGRQPVRQRVVGDNQMQRSVSTMGVGGQGWVSVIVLTMCCFIGDGGEGGEKVLIPTVPLLTLILRVG